MLRNSLSSCVLVIYVFFNFTLINRVYSVSINNYPIDPFYGNNRKAFGGTPEQNTLLADGSSMSHNPYSNDKMSFEEFPKFKFKDFMDSYYSYPMEENTLPRPEDSFAFPESPFPFSYYLPETSDSAGENDNIGFGYPFYWDHSYWGWGENDTSSDSNSTLTSIDTEDTASTANTTAISTTEISTDVTGNSTTSVATTTTTTTAAPEETTTLAPFTLADVKVPIPFLRIEYMISFTFFGLMYGLGFFVLFQSLCVPAAKIAVTIVYLVLVKLNAIEPVTLEMALEQLPPT